jgi:hypothetical protein
MFVIFGIKRLRRRLATMLAICGQCGTPAAQVVIRVSTWFSLFFIPVVPLGSKYFSTCTLCGKSMKLVKEQALHMVAVAEQVSSGPQAPALNSQAQVSQVLPAPIDAAEGTPDGP